MRFNSRPDHYIPAHSATARAGAENTMDNPAHPQADLEHQLQCGAVPRGRGELTAGSGSPRRRAAPPQTRGTASFLGPGWRCGGSALADTAVEPTDQAAAPNEGRQRVALLFFLVLSADQIGP